MQVTSQGAETSGEKAYLKVNPTATKHRNQAESEGSDY